MSEFGLAKVDITPRVGVELYGYGPFLNRHATAVREPLYARAFAASDGESTIVICSCDLVGVSREVTAEVRRRVTEATGLPADNVCVHGIHTHSGPRTKTTIGWGADDPPYMELLPRRIAGACIQAVENLTPAGLAHCVVPCEGIGYNREQDTRPELSEALSESWRPAKPEVTDTEAHVLRVDSCDGILGFLTYFSCHPVVGPSTSRYIHSDFAGVATNWLEREWPGAVGLFLQGCEGDINSCVVHHSEQDSLIALDVIAARYARQIRPGLQEAPELGEGPIRALRQTIHLTRAPVPREELEQMLREREATLDAPDADDADHAVRMATVYAIALRRELARQEAGGPMEYPAEIQGFRIGELLILGGPFEIMHRYKLRVQAEFERPVLVMGLCNDAMGYAPVKESFETEGNYAARMVPYLLGYPPFAPSVEDELVAALVGLGRQLEEA